jgi:hypothetical protein
MATLLAAGGLRENYPSADGADMYAVSNSNFDTSAHTADPAERAAARRYHQPTDPREASQRAAVCPRRGRRRPPSAPRARARDAAGNHLPSGSVTGAQGRTRAVSHGGPSSTPELFAYTNLGPVTAASVAGEVVAVCLCRGVSECREHGPSPLCQLTWSSCLCGRCTAFGVTEVIEVEGWCVNGGIGISCALGQGADLESPSIGAAYGDAADAGRWSGCLVGFVISHATSVAPRPYAQLGGR